MAGLHHLDVGPGAQPGHLACQRHHGEAVAVAYLDHEPVRIVEEELVHVDPTFLHHRPHVLDLHVFQLLLHRSHDLTLQT